MKHESILASIDDPKYSCLKDKEFVLSHIYPRVYPLFNEDGDYNELFSKGEEKVAMQNHDLLMLFTVEVEKTDEYTASMPVTTRFIESMGISREEVYEAAKKNFKDVAIMKDMGAILRDLSGMSEDIIPDTNKMFVATNKDKFYGAVAAFLPDLWSEYFDKIGAFYILPSSVHECILVKDEDEEMTAERISWLYDIVNAVTNNQVDKEERLPVSIYYYGKNGFEHVA